MIVAQYSVHAIAGLKPDYGIHFPNIRSPEGGQVDVHADFGVFAFSAYLSDFLLL
jgi:hypothetical protein